MNCQGLIQVLADYTSGQLPTTIVRECEEHLARCADCVSYSHSYRETIRIAQLMRPVDAPPIPSADVDRVVEGTMKRLATDRFASDHIADTLYFG